MMPVRIGLPGIFMEFANVGAKTRGKVPPAKLGIAVSWVDQCKQGLRLDNFGIAPDRPQYSLEADMWDTESNQQMALLLSEFSWLFALISRESTRSSKATMNAIKQELLGQ